MHDFQHATAEAAVGLLNDLKAGGYKVALPCTSSVFRRTTAIAASPTVELLISCLL